MDVDAAPGSELSTAGIVLPLGVSLRGGATTLLARPVVVVPPALTCDVRPAAST